MAEADVVVEPFDKALHDRSSFESVAPEYTRYFREIAGQHVRKGLSALYVAVRQGDTPPMQVFGYFTASMGAIKKDDVDEEIREDLGLPRLQIPTLHVGMMATDRHVEGKGIGSLLLTGAGKLAIDLRSRVGCWGLSLDMDEDHIAELRPWYEKRNFAPLKRAGITMVLPLKTFERAIAQSRR